MVHNQEESWQMKLFSDLYRKKLPAFYHMPADMEASMEYALDTFLSKEENAIVRDHFQFGMTVPEIARKYAKSDEEIKYIMKIFKMKFRHPMRSKYMILGIRDLMRELKQDATKEGLEMGYEKGREAHKAEMSLDECNTNNLAATTEFPNIYDIPEWRYRIECSDILNLDLSCRTETILRSDGFTKVGQLMHSEDSYFHAIPVYGVSICAEVRKKVKRLSEQIIKDIMIIEDLK